SVSDECCTGDGDECVAVLPGRRAQVSDVGHVVDDLAHDLLGLDRVVIRTVGIPSGDVPGPSRAAQLDGDDPVRDQHRVAGDRLEGDHVPDVVAVLGDGDHHVPW